MFLNKRKGIYNDASTRNHLMTASYSLHHPQHSHNDRSSICMTNNSVQQSRSSLITAVNVSRHRDLLASREINDTSSNWNTGECLKLRLNSAADKKQRGVKL